MSPLLVRNNWRGPALLATDADGRRPGKDPQSLTLSQAAVAVARSIVGPAALYLPHGVASAGLTGSTFLLALSFALFLAGSSRLVACWRWQLETTGKVMGYPELARHLAGPWAQRVVQFSVVCLQGGVCVTYFIFVSENAQLVLEALFGQALAKVDTNVLMAIMCCVEVPLCLVRDLTALSHFNSVANCFVGFSLLCILATSSVLLVERGPAEGVLWASVPYETAYLYLGTAIFAFEGAAAVTIPIANSVDPKDRPLFFDMYTKVIAVIAVTYFSYSSLAYLAYGPDVAVIVTLSLGDSVFPAAAVRVLYCVAVVLTFPLQLFPVTAEVQRVLLAATLTKERGGEGQRGERQQRGGGGERVEDEHGHYHHHHRRNHGGGSGGGGGVVYPNGGGAFDDGSANTSGAVAATAATSVPGVNNTSSVVVNGKHRALANRDDADSCDDSGGCGGGGGGGRGGRTGNGSGGEGLLQAGAASPYQHYPPPSPLPENDGFECGDETDPTITTNSFSSSSSSSPPPPSSSPSPPLPPPSWSWSSRFGGDLLRVCLVAALWLLAVLGRHSLDHIVALLGSLCSAPLALIVPPLMHNQVMKAKGLLRRRSSSTAAASSSSSSSSSYNRIVEKRQGGSVCGKGGAAAEGAEGVGTGQPREVEGGAGASAAAASSTSAPPRAQLSPLQGLTTTPPHARPSEEEEEGKEKASSSENGGRLEKEGAGLQEGEEKKDDREFEAAAASGCLVGSSNSGHCREGDVVVGGEGEGGDGCLSEEGVTVKHVNNALISMGVVITVATSVLVLASWGSASSR